MNIFTVSKGVKNNTDRYRVLVPRCLVRGAIGLSQDGQDKEEGCQDGEGSS
jgi:hypothetical protein